MVEEKRDSGNAIVHEELLSILGINEGIKFKLYLNVLMAVCWVSQSEFWAPETDIQLLNRWNTKNNDLIDTLRIQPIDFT